MILIVFLYMMFASLFSIEKEALRYCEPFFLVGSRMTCAGLVLLTWELLRDRNAFAGIRSRHIPGIVALGLSNIYLTNVLEIWAIKNMVSSKTCLIYSFSPFVAALVAYLVLNERISRRKLFGMAVGFFGILPIVFMQTRSEIASGTFLIFTLAELSVLSAVFCSVYGWIMLKKLVHEYRYTPLLANGLSMLLGGTLALFHSYAANESWAPFPVKSYPEYLTYAITIMLISNIICYNLYGFLLRRFSATLMSFAGLVTPIFASMIGFFWLGETVSWHYFLSLALFAVGMVIFFNEEMKAESSQRLVHRPDSPGAIANANDS